MMRRAGDETRGSLLVAALLLFSILLALGLGLMSSQSARMKVARSQTEAIQAKALCEAAWEDARVKLGKDILFPLPVDGQTFFAYSEDVYDSDGGLFGSYSVVIDLKLDALTRKDSDLSLDNDANVPKGIYQITCIGKLGRRTGEPEAERTMYYELDMTTFNVIRIEDRSSL